MGNIQGMGWGKYHGDGWDGNNLFYSVTPQPDMHMSDMSDMQSTASSLFSFFFSNL